MDISICQLRSTLANRKAKYKNLDIEASNQIIAIQQNINPYEDDITLLDTEKALQACERLHEIKLEMLELKPKIAKMEQSLKNG